MKKLILFVALLASAHAHAYTGSELKEDCQAAEEYFAEKKSGDPYQSIKSARCISYVAGFADSYAVSEYLAGKIGVGLNAFCLPKDPDLTRRLVRAVAIHVERVPPNSTASTATLVAGALAKAFPCGN